MTIKLHDEVTVADGAPHAGGVGVVDEIDAELDIALYHVLGAGFNAWYFDGEISPWTPPEDAAATARAEELQEKYADSWDREQAQAGPAVAA